MADQSTQSIVIDANAEAIMDVIGDFEAYPQWAGSIKNCTPVEEDGNGWATKVDFVLDALSLVVPVAAGGVADRVLDGTDPVPRVVASDVLCGAGTQRVPVQSHWFVLRVETRVGSSLRDAGSSCARDVRSGRSDNPSVESEEFADEKGRSPDEVDPTRLVLLLVAISPASPDAASRWSRAKCARSRSAARRLRRRSAS